MDGIAKVGAPSELEIARGRTRAAQMEMRCADPAERAKVAIYIGTREDGIGRFYMPPSAAWRFFEDGIHIYPVSGKRKAYVLEPWFLEGFDGGGGPREFTIYHHGFDPDLERRRGYPLPYHFHWLECDRKNPTVHCSTEAGVVWARAAFVTVEHPPKG